MVLVPRLPWGHASAPSMQISFWEASERLIKVGTALMLTVVELNTGFSDYAGSAVLHFSVPCAILGPWAAQAGECAVFAG